MSWFSILAGCFTQNITPHYPGGASFVRIRFAKTAEAAKISSAFCDFTSAATGHVANSASGDCPQSNGALRSGVFGQRQQRRSSGREAYVNFAIG